MREAAWIFGVVALASLASVAARRPWTTVIAKRHNPPELWSTDLFRETNLILSAGWSLLFAVAAILAWYASLWINLACGALLLALGRASPMLGAWYASRRLQVRCGDQGALR